MAVKPGEARAAYERLALRREDFLDRARDASRLTIPHVLPDEGHYQGNSLPTPYQSVGAQGVKNLSSKLLISLFPPNEPFFKLQGDFYPLLQATGGDREEVRKVEESLVDVVSAVSKEVESLAMRPSLYEAFMGLVVGGTVLYHMPDEGRPRTFKLDQHVIERDPEGNVLLIIVREDVAAEVLRGRLEAEPPTPAGSGAVLSARSGSFDYTDGSQDEPVEVFTVIQRVGKKFEVWQEWSKGEIPGSRGSWSEDRMEYIPLRMNVVSGEDYGRGVVEEHLGDLQSLEGLWMAIVQSSVEAARSVHFVRPGAVVGESEFASAETGDVLTGEEGDVYTHRIEKHNDLRVAYEAADRIEQRLNQAFLRGSSVQRNAERVTAEEVRFLIRELEEALGGAYAALAQELQLPLVTRIMDRMRRQRRLPEIPSEFVKPVVVTGVEALGRGQEFDRTIRWAAANAQVLGPAAQQWLKPRDFMARTAVQNNLEVEDLLRTKEEVEAEQQQAMQMQALSTPAASQAVKGMADAVNQQNAPPTQ